MDIQANKKSKKLRGDYGYVKYTKSYNLKYGMGILLLCFIIFFIGTSFFETIESFFLITSVLMVLPAAQYLARYFSFNKYKAVSEEVFNQINAISDDFLVLGELPIIRGKKVYLFKMTIITSVGVYTLIDSKLDIVEAQKCIESIIQPKGHHLPIQCFYDADKLTHYLKTEIKSKAQNPKVTVQEKIAELMLLKTH